MDFCGIVLLVESPAFLRESPYDIKLWGKSMKDWVTLALGTEVKYINYKQEAEIADCVRPYITDSEYTVVLYSDTPLIRRKTVTDALTHLINQKLDVIKLVRGFIFRTSFLKSGQKVSAPKSYYCGDDDFLSAPDFSQLSVVSEALKSRIINYHMSNGVHFIDPSSVYIDAETVIGKSVTVYPNNTLTGKTIIEDGVTLFAGNVINESRIAKDAKITSSNITQSIVGAGTSVGPYAYIRPDTVIGDNCRIGDFVEIKKSVIGDKSKVSHLAYVGDAEIGSGCNIGCGVVFVNYDGKNKSKTVLGNHVFVGSNSNLIAPLKLEDNAYVAAGSTLNEDVPQNALAIARARQVVKPDWNKDKY